MDLDVSFPGADFFLREAIAAASFLETDDATRTAATTAALRRGTHRIVSAGGK